MSEYTHNCDFISYNYDFIFHNHEYLIIVTTAHNYAFKRTTATSYLIIMTSFFYNYDFVSWLWLYISQVYIYTIQLWL